MATKKIELGLEHQKAIEEFVIGLGAGMAEGELDQNITKKEDGIFKAVKELALQTVEKFFNFKDTKLNCDNPECSGGKIDLSNGIEYPEKTEFGEKVTSFPCKKCGCLYALIVNKTVDVMWDDNGAEMERCFLVNGEVFTESKLPSKTD